MMNHKDNPCIGHWYQSPEFDDDFEVIATDEESAVVDIQFIAGEIEELDMETWLKLQVTEIDSPKDWAAPFELQAEDLSSLYSDDPIHPERWTSTLNHLDSLNL